MAIKKLIDIVSSLGKEQMSLEKDISKLPKNLATINLVLKDAEEKQVSDKLVLMRWLQDLKDFAYDVENIFDEFETEAEIDSAVRLADDTMATKECATLQGAIGRERVKTLQLCGNILGNCFSGCSSSRSSSKHSPIITRLNIADRIKVLMETFDDLLKDRVNLNLMVLPNQPTMDKKANKQAVGLKPVL